MAEIYRMFYPAGPISVQTAQLLDEVKGTFCAAIVLTGCDLDSWRAWWHRCHVAAFDAVVEAEINPVLVRADGVIRLDALIG